MAIINANQLMGFTLEISGREIYNDIRAKCDVTEILTVRPDATPDLFLPFTASTISQQIEPREQTAPFTPTTAELIATADPDHSEIVWGAIVDYSFHPETILGWGQGACEELGGWWRYSSRLGTSLCSLPQSLVDQDVEFEIVDKGDTTCTIEVINNSDYLLRGKWYVSYIALTPETRYIKLRSTNTASIAKYGRRAMNLDWPLGIVPVAMQALIDNYCARYCEPVSMASMTLEGDTDAKITQILDMDIDNKHQIIHAGLDMDQEFFVNSLSGLFSREGSGMLTGTFGLEEVRAMEELTIFTLDVSELDGDHVLG